MFALSTTEVEYVALLTTLRDVIPVMDILKEMQELRYGIEGNPSIKCKVF
jgi:hypothetical protein